MAFSPPGRTRERVYEFVRRSLLEGRPPTVRDVQGAMGFRAVQSARSHLEALVAEGRLAKAPGQARGYHLPGISGPRGELPLVQVPLLGQVQAGDLNTAVQSPQGYVPTRSRYPAGDLFALKVRGRSMTGAGILPGDLVVVHRQLTAESGDIVVALVGEEATVKRLRLRRGRPELVPANPSFQTIVPDPEQVTLLGKVIEVRRVLE